MSNFKIALDILLQNEGGYSNNSADKGSETYRGISRKYHPDWKGWSIIDAHAPLKQGAFINDPLLDTLVEQFYQVEYWNKIKADKVHSQRISNFLFDWYVNSGYHAIEAIQSLTDQKPNGIMTDNTILAINNADEGLLYIKLLQARRDFVKRIVQNSPSQEKFLQGWLNRINSFV